MRKLAPSPAREKRSAMDDPHRMKSTQPASLATTARLPRRTLTGTFTSRPRLPTTIVAAPCPRAATSPAVETVATESAVLTIK